VTKEIVQNHVTDVAYVTLLSKNYKVQRTAELLLLAYYIWVNQSVTTRRHVACNGTNAYKILVGKSNGEKPLLRPMPQIRLSPLPQFPTLLLRFLWLVFNQAPRDKNRGIVTVLKCMKQYTFTSQYASVMIWYSKGHSPSWEANGFPASQEIPSIV